MAQNLVILATAKGFALPRVKTEAGSFSEACELIASYARVPVAVVEKAIDKTNIDTDTAVCSFNGAGYFLQHWSL